MLERVSDNEGKRCSASLLAHYVVTLVLWLIILKYKCASECQYVGGV